MGSLRRAFFALALIPAGLTFRGPPAFAQTADDGDARATPLLRGVARLSCGTPMPRTYSLATRPGAGTEVAAVLPVRTEAGRQA